MKFQTFFCVSQEENSISLLDAVFIASFPLASRMMEKVFEFHFLLCNFDLIMIHVNVELNQT